MITPYFLKFENKAQAVSVGLVAVDDETPLTPIDGIRAIHVVDTITKQVAGEVNEDGNQEFTTEVVSGFHVNILATELPAELFQYVINVDSPYCKFAGY